MVRAYLNPHCERRVPSPERWQSIFRICRTRHSQAHADAPIVVGRRRRWHVLLVVAAAVCTTKDCLPLHSTATQ